MNESQALSLVARMFHAHGRNVSPEVAAEYALEILDSDCHPCMSEVVEEFRKHGAKVATVPTMWAAYRERVRSVSHVNHVGQDERALDVGMLEARWRTEGVKAVVAGGVSGLEADYIAAQMWASGAVDVNAVATEVENPIWRVANMPGGLTQAKVEAAWEFARTLATEPPDRMTQERWSRVLARYEMARAS